MMSFRSIRFPGRRTDSEGDDRIDVGHLVHQQEIAHEQGRFHGTGRNLERLDDESHHEKDENGGFGDELEILPEYALVPFYGFLGHDASRLKKRSL